MRARFWAAIAVFAFAAGCSDDSNSGTTPSGAGGATTSSATTTSATSGASTTDVTTGPSTTGSDTTSATAATTGGAGGAPIDDGGTTGAGGGGSPNDAGSGGGAPDGGTPPGDGGMFGPIPPGMIQIFDGKTLNGWNGNPAIWSVNAADGAIDGKTNNGGQLIKSAESYDTFRLIVVERMVATNNHLGICLWGGGKTPWGYDQCIVWIGPQGSLWDYKSGGGVFSGKGDNGIRFMWHQIEILANSATGQILAAVNGKQTTDYTKAGRAMKGPIGLQAHAGASEVEYKDIWIDPAPKEMKLLTVK
jgi:hypothetical protein